MEAIGSEGDKRTVKKMTALTTTRTTRDCRSLFNKYLAKGYPLYKIMPKCAYAITYMAQLVLHCVWQRDWQDLNYNMKKVYDIRLYASRNIQNFLEDSNICELGYIVVFFR